MKDKINQQSIQIVSAYVGIEGAASVILPYVFTPDNSLDVDINIERVKMDIAEEKAIAKRYDIFSAFVPHNFTHFSVVHFYSPPHIPNAPWTPYFLGIPRPSVGGVIDQYMLCGHVYKGVVAVDPFSKSKAESIMWAIPPIFGDGFTATEFPEWMYDSVTPNFSHGPGV